MTNYHARRILTHLTDSRYQPRKPKELAEDLGVPDDQFGEFSKSVHELVETGQVVLGSSNVLQLPPPGREMVGVFRLHPRGFGFLVPESLVEHGDLFIPAGRSGGGLTGDLVRARVVHESGRARDGRSPYTGTIVEILKRADRKYVGSIKKVGRSWVVVADGKHMPEPIVIGDPHAKGARPGSKVVVELSEYPTADSPPRGVIVEVLGAEGEPDVETKAVVRAFGLSEGFDEGVLEQARGAALAFGDGSGTGERLDLTGKFILTIDPPDAKDFDDAISVDLLDPKREPDGAVYELGVHIADVATFVPLGSALDQEAYGRGNSTYLPRLVVPMLPELLSNGVCSLQEGVNRWCKSAFIRYDGEGHVLGQRVANTKIKSAKRLTYVEAQALIDGDVEEAKKHSRSETDYPEGVVPTLQLLDKLARVLRARRLSQGMVVLNLPQVDLVFGDEGHVIDAVPEDNAFTHTLIEMCMVEANEAVARLFDGLQVPMIRRIHPDPDPHGLGDLRQFTRVAGYSIPKQPSRMDLQNLLNAARGKPAQYAVHLAVLKTLSKAEYSPSVIGHFALASEHYTHFTSPIRRYPDLVVHRALQAYLELTHEMEGAGEKVAGVKGEKRLRGGLADDERCPDEAGLIEIGQHCSATERNSEAAERHLRDVLVLQLISEHVGDEFEGTVTGVASAGVFVQIDRYLVDGFIQLEDLHIPGQSQRRERWRLNRQTGALVASQSGRVMSLGERFVVQVVKVDPPSRKLDLMIVGSLDGGKGGAKAGGGSKKKGKGGAKGGGKASGKGKAHPPRRSKPALGRGKKTKRKRR